MRWRGLSSCETSVASVALTRERSRLCLLSGLVGFVSLAAWAL
jgi:hypothetical protein